VDRASASLDASIEPGARNDAQSQIYSAVRNAVKRYARPLTDSPPAKRARALPPCRRARRADRSAALQPHGV